MARVTYVKKAQQRYAMVKTETRTPVLRKDGEQKVTKKGRPVFRTASVADKTRPLPNHSCDKCRKEIEVGQPYKWIAPKSGPYGGRKMFRCGTCPSWQIWEYSSSLSARLAEVVHNAEEALESCENKDDFESWQTETADSIREIAEEQREKASNIEDGFGHETSMSQELNEQGDEIESWADDVESCMDSLDDPEEEVDCEDCNGAGTVECSECSGNGTVTDPEDSEKDVACPVCDEETTVECEECDGSGQITPEEPSEEWLEDARSQGSDALSNCPF